MLVFHNEEEWQMDHTYGYVRVSSVEQNEDRQMIALKKAGVSDRHIFIDKQSGKDFHRLNYEKMVSRLQEGDLLYILSIDRLGRDYVEIQNQWRMLTKEIGVDICVIDMPLLDTRQGRDLTGTLIADIVLQLLSYVAQTERENIRQRQAEGIAAALARGVRFGPERMLLPEEFDYFAELWRKGSISSRQAAEELGMSYQTFLRRAKEVAAEG